MESKEKFNKGNNDKENSNKNSENVSCECVQINAIQNNRGSEIKALIEGSEPLKEQVIALDTPRITIESLMGILDEYQINEDNTERLKLSNFNKKFNEKDILDVFVPVKLSYSSYKKEDKKIIQVTHFITLEDIVFGGIEKEEVIGDNSLYIICGNINTGKSTYLKYFLKSNIENYKTKEPKRVPVFMGAKELLEKITKKDTEAVPFILNKRNALSKDIKKIDFFIDALDEIEESKDRIFLLQSLQDLSRSCNVIVTTRRTDELKDFVITPGYVKSLYETGTKDTKNRYRLIELNGFLSDEPEKRAELVENNLLGLKSRGREINKEDIGPLLELVTKEGDDIYDLAQAPGMIINICIAYIQFLEENSYDTSKLHLEEWTISKIYEKCFDKCLSELESLKDHKDVFGFIAYELFKRQKINQNEISVKELKAGINSYVLFKRKEKEEREDLSDLLEEEILKSSFIYMKENGVYESSHLCILHYFLAKHLYRMDEEQIIPFKKIALNDLEISDEENQVYGKGEMEIFRLREKDLEKFNSNAFQEVLKIYINMEGVNEARFEVLIKRLLFYIDINTGIDYRDIDNFGGNIFASELCIATLYKTLLECKRFKKTVYKYFEPYIEILDTEILGNEFEIEHSGAESIHYPLWDESNIDKKGIIYLANKYNFMGVLNNLSPEEIFETLKPQIDIGKIEGVANFNLTIQKIFYPLNKNTLSNLEYIIKETLLHDDKGNRKNLLMVIACIKYIPQERVYEWVKDILKNKNIEISVRIFILVISYYRSQDTELLGILEGYLDQYKAVCDINNHKPVSLINTITTVFEDAYTGFQRFNKGNFLNKILNTFYFHLDIMDFVEGCSDTHNKMERYIHELDMSSLAAINTSLVFLINTRFSDTLYEVVEKYVDILSNTKYPDTGLFSDGLAVNDKGKFVLNAFLPFSYMYHSVKTEKLLFKIQKSVLSCIKYLKKYVARLTDKDIDDATINFLDRDFIMQDFPKNLLAWFECQTDIETQSVYGWLKKNNFSLTKESFLSCWFGQEVKKEIEGDTNNIDNSFEGKMRFYRECMEVIERIIGKDGKTGELKLLSDLVGLKKQDIKDNEVSKPLNSDIVLDNMRIRLNNLSDFIRDRFCNTAEFWFSSFADTNKEVFKKGYVSKARLFYESLEIMSISTVKEVEIAKEILDDVFDLTEGNKISIRQLLEDIGHLKARESNKKIGKLNDILTYRPKDNPDVILLASLLKNISDFDRFPTLKGMNSNNTVFGNLLAVSKRLQKSGIATAFLLRQAEMFKKERIKYFVVNVDLYDDQNNLYINTYGAKSYSMLARPNADGSELRADRYYLVWDINEILKNMDLNKDRLPRLGEKILGDEPEIVIPKELFERASMIPKDILLHYPYKESEESMRFCKDARNYLKKYLTKRMVLEVPHKDRLGENEYPITGGIQLINKFVYYIVQEIMFSEGYIVNGANCKKNKHNKTETIQYLFTKPKVVKNILNFS